MKFDVIVVGAGPAGSTAAKYLAENDVKVLLIDKSKFPRDKSCGGGIPIRVLSKFKYISFSTCATLSGHSILHLSKKDLSVNRLFAASLLLKT